MALRNQSGAMLVMCVASALVITIVGISVFTITRITGGAGEVQSATDAGSLNVAKQALISPGTKLQGSIEIRNFNQFANTSATSSNGEIDLLRYNRVLGQTLLVALNAKSDGTTDGLSHASILCQTVCSTPSSIGGRLRSRLTSGESINPLFSRTASANSVRMVNADSSTKHVNDRFQAAYMERGGATNVFVSPSLATMIPASFTVKRLGRTYLKGYQPLQVGAVTLMGTSLQPQEQPHLVSERQFQANIDAPAQLAPPNAFRSSATATIDNFASHVAGTACALTGVVSTSQEYELGIPGGYIEIVNPKGVDFSSPYGISPASFITTQGQSTQGVFVSQSASNGPAAFSSDIGLLAQWAAFNAHPQGQPPTLNGLYNKDGNPATAADADLISNQYAQCGGPGGSMGGYPCYSLLPAFSKAYDGTTWGGNITQSRNALMSVEYHKPYCYWKVFEQEAGPIACQPDKITGLRKYRGDLLFHARQYAGTDGWGQISDSGTLSELLAQCNSTQALSFLRGRIAQIKPSASSAEIEHVLADASHKLDMTFQDEHLYIYMNQSTHALVCSATKPSTYTGAAPDGKKLIEERSYPLLGSYINPPHDFDIHLQPWRTYPSGPTWIGHDRVVVTTSSGYDNMLGQIRFENQVTGPDFNGVQGTGSASGSGYFADYN